MGIISIQWSSRNVSAYLYLQRGLAEKLALMS